MHGTRTRCVSWHFGLAMKDLGMLCCTCKDRWGWPGLYCWLPCVSALWRLLQAGTLRSAFIRRKRLRCGQAVGSCPCGRRSRCRRGCSGLLRGTAGGLHSAGRGKARLGGQRWPGQARLGAILIRRRPGQRGLQVQGGGGGRGRQLRGAPQRLVEDQGCEGIAGWGGRTGGDVQGASQGAPRGCLLEVQAQHLLREVRPWCRMT